MPTARPWSWAPQTKTKFQAQFPALRVLFCGSDGFSIPSFHMLRELHLRRNDIISKLAVVTPTDRPSGRGLKVLKPTPMTTLARQMQWPHSHAAKFLYTPDEMPPGSWDLIIAVSFGHKISPKVLAQCSAGGLNVHPSKLPKYRGPAPLHHTLLNADQETEVCIQTIHPTEFDEGDIIARSVPIEILPATSLTSLTSQTAQVGAQLLREVLVAGYPCSAQSQPESGEMASYAGKITKDEMQIDWKSWNVERVTRWAGVLGSLWTKLDGKIVKLRGMSPSATRADADQGSIRVEDGSLLVRAANGWIAVDELTIAGKPSRNAASAHDLDGRHFEN